jgi:hypothetical protein
MIALSIVIAIGLFTFSGLKLMGGESGSLRDFIGFMTVVIACMLTLAYLVAIPFYLAAGYKAEIINEQFGTSYTREQVMFASDVIDSVREVQRQRIELNGDLVKGVEK